MKPQPKPLPVPPCAGCGEEIDFETGDRWVWLKEESDPTHTICCSCLTTVSESDEVQQAKGWKKGSVSQHDFLFELSHCNPRDGGLQRIVLAAFDETHALILALGECKDEEDLDWWIHSPGDIHAYALGPVFMAALQGTNIVGGIVCAEYAGQSAKEGAAK